MTKEKPQFQIISGRRATTHESYYTGTLNLSNLSAVLVDGDQAKIDLGLIHGKSRVERGIRFTATKEEVGEGKNYWVVWVAVGRNEKGSYYAGVTACPMMINHDTRRGWKNLADHVNRMDDALKRRIKIEQMDATERQTLCRFLKQYDASMWSHSTEELTAHLES